MTKSDAERMAELEAKLDALKQQDAPKHHSEEHYSQAALAWRMVIEMVTGLGLGVAIGMGLDAVFGTQPFLLIPFALFGFVAGIKTMMRSAKEIQDAVEQNAQGDGSAY